MANRLTLFEDEHLLVINKPAGINTHSPSPFTGEGVYEWLKNREPRWANLAIIHRLDKETSGLLVFGKTTVANRSLTSQFEQRAVKKTYLLLTDRAVPKNSITAKSSIVRVGEKYASRPLHAGGEIAETRFRSDDELLVSDRRIAEAASFCRQDAGSTLVLAEPVTGRTHQIRVHAAEHGFPILGDTLYGGTRAERVFLHAYSIQFKHPVSGDPLTFTAPPDFDADPRFTLRTRLIGEGENERFEKTNALRLINGAADGWPGWYVDRLGDYLLSQCERTLEEPQARALQRWMQRDRLRGVYHKTLSRHVRGASTKETSPQLVLGEAAPEEVQIRENGATYSIRFHEGYSVGIFLDQRDNRRRLLTGYIAPGFSTTLPGSTVLNTFAYTCAFSVAAAKGGASVTSLDLSKKYLDWGRRNFELNGINSSEHDFIFGDVFDWLRRLGKKQRTFDMVLLDPPTFSQSKEFGVFRVEKDYGTLVTAALKVLKPNGILFASTNAAELKPEVYLEKIKAAVLSNGRRIVQQHFQPQPPDFPVTRDEPAYLKTVWLRIACQSA